MTDGLNSLLGWAGKLSGASTQLGRLSAVVLQPPLAGGEPHCLSVLNNDGSPLQVCVTYARRGRKLRIIGDPAAHIEDPDLRFVHAQRAIAELLTLTGTHPLADTCEETLRRMLPARKNIEALRPGSLWLAAGLDGGAAMYVNTRWGDAKQRWRDAADWLSTLMPNRGAAKTVIDAISAHAAIASVGLEGATAKDTRLKLYWRLNSPIAIEQMGVPLLAHPAYKDFLLRLVADKPLSLGGLVLSAGFGLCDGALHDVKIDLCAHCLPRPAADWVSLLSDCCQEFGLAPLDIADGLISHQCELAFVGFGIDRSENRRINLYMKAPTTRH